MIIVFLFGFLFSFFGYMFPSVLNMNALKISLKGNNKQLTHFVFGASSIVFLQAYLSVYLTVFIRENPSFLIFLEKTGVFILLGLSVYFYTQNKKDRKQITTRKVSKNGFITGATLSLLNMFSIPFFFGSASLLMAFDSITFDFYAKTFFVLGAVLGCFFILNLYGKYATKIQQKTGTLTNHLNLILSFITAIFAVFTFLKFVI
ncbi:LysE family transporter [uncultured Polaribacter sp.]|uniref:LysE family transporter n=1 Tax=uncultured Polaribacter sp. TaxID=174711 RepID=UPI00261BF36C|nr:LysE family transporter [uncultured Polaribacter sp.]